MSSKSMQHHPQTTAPLFSRKFLIIGGLILAAMFFVVITYYPLIFSPEKPAPAAPATADSAAK